MADRAKRSNYTPLRTSTAARNRYSARPHPWWNRLALRGTATNGAASPLRGRTS